MLIIEVAGVAADGRVYVWAAGEDGTGKTGIPLDQVEFVQPEPVVVPQSLADLVREALAYLDAGGARVNLARVRRYVLDNAGRSIDLGAMKRVYGVEQQRRQRDRAWQRQLASLATMKISALTALDKRVQRILADGPGTRNYGWAWRLMPHISAEQDRRAEVADRLKPGRRGRTVDQALLFAEVEDQIAAYRASTKRRRGPIARAAHPVGAQGSGGGVLSPPAPAPVAPPASVGSLPSLLAGIRRYHAAQAAGGD